MERQDNRSVFDELLVWLKNNMSLTSYHTWTRPLQFEGIYGKEFTMAVQIPSTRDFLEKNYTALFRNGLQAVAPGMGYQPVFKLPSDPEAEKANLNPRYTFDTFVVGSGNRFAYTAARAIAEKPARAYNPFLIYGGSGLGKTHLMHAIGHQILADDPHARILYVTSEEFTNNLIRAIQNKQNEIFRNRYRHVDVLLIDDIQFIAGKQASQEEFFHTFNALYQSDKQIVLTSDIHPNNMPMLEERLRSRFVAGLIYDIQPPDLETRAAILRSKLESEQLAFDDDAVVFIAGMRESNVRELEGYISRVRSFSNLTNRRITRELCADALHDVLPDETRVKPIDIDMITEAVCSFYSVTSEDLKSQKRSHDIAYARQVAMYLCRSLTDQPLKEIGERFGGRDHSTVIHGIAKIEEQAKTDTELRERIDRIKENLTGGRSV